MQGPSTFDSRTKARSLAFLFAAAGLVGILTVAFPHQDSLSVGPVLTVAAVSLALALACLRIGERISEPLLHGGLALVTLSLSLLVHYTEQATLYPLIYMWPALYAFYVFSTPNALAHLAFIGAAYGTVLAIDDTMDATIRLVLVLGTPLVIGLLISRLLGKMREGMARMARQERALRSSERRTRLIVDSARDGFISTDAQGRVLDVNGAAERLLGRSRADVVGRPFQELGIPPEEHERFEARRRALLDGGREDGTRHLALRVQIDRPDGTRLLGETMIWVVERDGEWMFNARLTDIGDRLREQHERERLVAAEAAREQAERATTTIARLQAVADAALTQHHLDDLLPAILQRTKEVMDADAAAVLLIQDDGSLSLLAADDAVTGPRPERVRADAGIAGQVLARFEPVLVDDPIADQLADPAVLEAGISCILGVPLVSADEIIGVIEIGVCPPRRLGSDDVDLLRLTADRVALAIDHARAYGREHRIAETLQRSLLPQTLPSLPGVTLAARYLPAASESEVGGDWYDAIGLPGGRLLLVMGDVSGKGLAAASTLGALRNAIRAYALDGHGPAQIADRLNRFVLAEPAHDHMATLVLAIVRRRHRAAVVGQRRPPAAADARRRRHGDVPRGRALGAARRARVPRLRAGRDGDRARRRGRALHRRADRAPRRAPRDGDGAAGLGGVRRPAAGRGAVRPAAGGGAADGRDVRRRRAADAVPCAARLAPGVRHAQPAERAGVAARAAAPLAGAEPGVRRRRACDRHGLQRGVHERDRARGRGGRRHDRLHGGPQRRGGRRDGARSRTLARSSPAERPGTGPRADRGADGRRAGRPHVGGDDRAAAPAHRRACERMTAPATLRSERLGDHVVVTLLGEVDVFNAAEIANQIEAAVPTDAHGAVLDLSGVGFLDSTAIRKLFALAGRLVERRQRVHVVSPEGSMVLRTLELVEFSRAAPMHDSLEQALEAARRESAERG